MPSSRKKRLVEEYRQVENVNETSHFAGAKTKTDYQVLEQPQQNRRSRPSKPG